MKTDETNRHHRKLLIVDDDRFFSESIKDDFADLFGEIRIANTVGAAKELCEQINFDAILLDNNLPDGSGLTVIPIVLKQNDAAKIILVTAFPNFEHAVQALKTGAYDYVSKPIELEELRVSVERALQAAALEAVEAVAQYNSARERRESTLIGCGREHEEIQELVRRAGNSAASVLITGETGTGKNVVAKAIHFASAHESAAFISVNCAAFPENLIEAELFGVEKGAFTGAIATRKGTFELADGGTLFLDEIGEMPFQLQAKLLSALEDRRVKRVGGSTERTIKVKIVAATNAEPERAIAENRLRRDLYYRLGVLRIHLKPLRERKDEIPILCNHFIEQFARGRRVELPADEIRILQNYDFPGNVRELRNIIERCVILQEGKLLRPSQIIAPGENVVAHAAAFVAASAANTETVKLADVEKTHILNQFARFNRNIARTADALDVSLSTLKRKLREYGER